jgi:vesicle transport through interaction with t-SNAREs protein 1
MPNPLDTEAGSELFSSYEAELKLIQADLNQKLDQISERTGEDRKGAIRQAERVLEEAYELVSPVPHARVASGLPSRITYAERYNRSIKCEWRKKTSRLPPDQK